LSYWGFKDVFCGFFADTPLFFFFLFVCFHWFIIFLCVLSITNLPFLAWRLRKVLPMPL
jgi:hypothetical protein